MPDLDLTVLVITYNEEKNIVNLLDNVKGFAKRVVILDSFSTDSTVSICEKYGAEVLFREFDNFSLQRNFLLTKISHKTEWLLFLDADEILTPELKSELERTLSNTDKDSFFIKRRFHWKGAWIRRGYYPTWLLRVGRVGTLLCDQRSVNEHLVCTTNKCGYLENDFIDNNHKGLTEWIDKHNLYSSSEARLLLEGDNNEYDFWGSQFERKRWIRKYVWFYLPSILRPFLFFAYRYFLCGGFLDGSKALQYHFLHAFWYRCIIEFKYKELVDVRKTSNE